MKHVSLILTLFAIAGCSAPSGKEPPAVTFRVIAHDIPEPHQIYVAGNLPLLGTWDPDGLRLARESDSSWSATVSIPAGQTLEFKITRGSWGTEAVGSDGLERPNVTALVEDDTTLTIAVAQWRDRVHVVPLLSDQRLQNKGGIIELIDRWKFSPGDNPAWAELSIDDSTWEEVRSYLPPDEPLPRGWTGIGWFRLHFVVDSSLQGRALAFHIHQTGASQWFLNGDSAFTLGTVSSTIDSERAYNDFSPRILVLPPRSHQVLAVRYSNHRAEDWHHLATGAGFVAVLEHTQGAIAGTVDRIRTSSVYQILLTTVGAILGALHFLLFAFERRELANLYFSLVMIGVTVLTYMDFVWFFSTDPVTLLQLAVLRGIPLGIIVVFAPLTAYATTGRPVPRYAMLTVVVALVVAAWLYLAPSGASEIGVPILVALVSAEVIRVLLSEVFSRRRMGHSIGITGWIGGTGAIIYIVGVMWQMLINLDILPGVLPIPPIFAGFMVFAIGVSANLAWQWSSANRVLRAQIEEIEKLSARGLEQERRAHQEEVQRRLLEADNLRKTQELEEARRLQLSMLPQAVPSVKNLDIAVYMRTATEVGGDYYDFLQTEDGSLTIAVGDATGHGMKAGLMVTLVKSMFHTRGQSFFIPDFFNYGTTLIRRMNMEGLYMSLMLARIEDGRITLSSAGMPPVLIHRAATGSVEEFRITGMPLGASPGFPYTQKTTTLDPGDTLVIMSDGLPERFNASKETFDFGRVMQTLEESAGESPARIIDALVAAGERWSGGTPPRDDMTFVVVRSTSGASSEG